MFFFTPSSLKASDFSPFFPCRSAEYGRPHSVLKISEAAIFVVLLSANFNKTLRMWERQQRGGKREHREGGVLFGYSCFFFK